MNDQKVTVLVVDDDTDTRNIVSAGVQSMGYDSVEAADGEQALKAWETSVPSLVVLDLMMPGMSGKEVCRWIKSREDGKVVPVLILTAMSQLEDKVDLLDSGAEDYLTKPFDMRELKARINALLRIGQLNRHLSDKNKELEAAQAKIIEQERKLLAMQLGGTTAHQLGQPLTAIKLNIHLLELLPKEDEKYQKGIAAIKADVQRMVELVEQLRTVDPSSTESYYGKTSILGIKK